MTSKWRRCIFEYLTFDYVLTMDDCWKKWTCQFVVVVRRTRGRTAVKSRRMVRRELNDVERYRESKSNTQAIRQSVHLTVARNPAVANAAGTTATRRDSTAARLPDVYCESSRMKVVRELCGGRTQSVVLQLQPLHKVTAHPATKRQLESTQWRIQKY